MQLRRSCNVVMNRTISSNKKKFKSRLKHVANFKHLVFIFLQLDCLKNKIKIKLALKLIINELASSDGFVENAKLTRASIEQV